MTIWRPRLATSGDTPRYRAIADALARDVAAGRVAAGTRLPTHRDLADALGVTVGTVTRAYGEAARRGLVSGEVGRGTYVRHPSETARFLSQPGFVDLSLNHPPPADAALAAELTRTLQGLSQNTSAALLLDYPPEAGIPRHREAGARWVAPHGLDVSADQVLVTSGSQHAITTVLTAFLKPGELVLTEQLTYSGLKALAGLLGLRLGGLGMDRDGLLPDAFEAACRSGGVRALYCVPTLHNPTTSVMPIERRQAVAAIAQRYGVLIIEDDVHGGLCDTPLPAVASFAPEISFYLSGTAKALAPGLRIGFLIAPRDRVPRLAASIRATTYMAAPLMAELVTRWIDDGTALRVLAAHRAEARARQQVAQRALGGAPVETAPNAFHLWLPLPEPWSSEGFAAAARERGVGVTPSSAFVVGRGTPPAAVRVCLGAARDRTQLERGLAVVAELLNSPADLPLSIV